MEIIFPEWRKANETTRYPFSEACSLTNSEGLVLVEGVFLDAALFPVGASAGLYLATVTIDHESVRLGINDGLRREVCAGTFPLVRAPDCVNLADDFGRPAGVLVSESLRLGVFQAWGVGTHAFQPAQTEFAATVCFPTPEPGVRGVLLDDGTLLSGEVWFVGGPGVVLRPDGPGVVRVDVVGDPLFRRKLCVPSKMFATPRVVKQLHVVGPNGAFDCFPDENGNVNLGANNALAADTVLRITTGPDGITVAVVGG